MKHDITVSEAVKRFYRKLAKNQVINYVDLPRSEVYYARWLLWEKLGVWYQIDQVQIAMWLEGMLPPSDVTSIPEWYTTKYLFGQDFNVLKKEVVKKYFKRLLDKTKRL